MRDLGTAMIIGGLALVAALLLFRLVVGLVSGVWL